MLLSSQIAAARGKKKLSKQDSWYLPEVGKLNKASDPFAFMASERETKEHEADEIDWNQERSEGATGMSRTLAFQEFVL
jgi:hypothetical protein